MTAQQVYDVMDSLLFLMAAPNIIGLYLMAAEVRRDLRSYVTRLRHGQIPTAQQLAAMRARVADSGARQSACRFDDRVARATLK